jgi:integrase/recombinase XerD
VRLACYPVIEGKTPEITIEPARRLLKSINVSNVVGLRDRAAFEVIIYTIARVGPSRSSS